MDKLINSAIEIDRSAKEISESLNRITTYVRIISDLRDRFDAEKNSRIRLLKELDDFFKRSEMRDIRELKILNEDVYDRIGLFMKIWLTMFTLNIISLGIICYYLIRWSIIS